MAFATTPPFSLRCLASGVRAARAAAAASPRSPPAARLRGGLPSLGGPLQRLTVLPRATDRAVWLAGARRPPLRQATMATGAGGSADGGDDGKPVGWSTVLSSPTPPPSSEEGASAPPLDSARAAHILTPTEAAADEAWAEVAAGKPWDNVAAATSTCPSASSGGDLGWFRRGAMVAAFEEVAFGHPVGAVVKVRTGFGWHLVRVTGARAGVASASVHQLADRLAAPGPPPQLIDVREAGELEAAALPAATHVPMSELGGGGGGGAPATLEGMDKDAETYVLCHHGIRSRNVADALVRGGWSHVINVEGGIHAYATEVDPSVGTY